MRDVDARIFLDLPPGQSLENFSVSELVDLAKRTVLGPETWSQHSKPVIAQKTIVYPNISPGNDLDDFLHLYNEVKLLPGGKWVLFRRNWTLECWNVAENTLIWGYHSPSEADVLDSAEVVDGGQAAVIIMGQSTY